MSTYKINEAYARKHDNLYTLNAKGEAIALLKEGVRVYDGGKNGPAKTVKIPLASQADLKYLYEQGTSFIEIDETPILAQVKQTAVK